jgi:hypothetical protein
MKTGSMKTPSTKKATLLAVFVLLAASCGAENPSSPKPVALGTSFVLKPSESAKIEGLEIAFEGVKDDSRCPVGVQCIWAGDAIVTLALRQAPAARETRQLHAVQDGRETTYGGYRVVLEALAPAPRADAPIAPEAYRATLKVDLPR